MFRSSSRKSTILLGVAILILVVAGILAVVGFFGYGGYFGLRLAGGRNIIESGLVNDEGVLSFGIVYGEGYFHVNGPDTMWEGRFWVCGYAYPKTTKRPMGIAFEAANWLWSLILVGVALVCLRMRSKIRLKFDESLCPTCGYDLHAHHPGQKCPECGTPVPPPASPPPAPPPAS
jgi:hypothetical protein